VRQVLHCKRLEFCFYASLSAKALPVFSFASLRLCVRFSVLFGFGFAAVRNLRILNLGFGVYLSPAHGSPKRSFGLYTRQMRAEICRCVNVRERIDAVRGFLGGSGDTVGREFNSAQ
jgi:hypothetical protein